MKEVANRSKLCLLIFGLSLSFLFTVGCIQSQPTVTTPAAPVLTPAQSVVPPTLTPIVPIPTPQATQNTAQPTATPSAIAVPIISTLDAYNLIQKNKDGPDFIIIDVRTVDEFKSGHIANSINVDYYSPDFKSIIGKLDKNKQYLVYCRTGIRGATATQIMVDLGFKEVHNLSGGIVKWIQDGCSIVI